MGAYVAFNVAAMTGAFEIIENRPAAWLFAAAVSAPVLGQIWATLALLNESDEYVRALTAKRFIAAAGLTMGLFTAWGFAETYAGAARAPGRLVFGLFWLCYGVITPFVRSTR